MSEILSSLFKNFSAAQTISKSIQVCTATIFFFNCASHINDEIVYIWKMPWTRGKILYLLARYSGALFLITAIILDYPILWEEVGHTLDDGEPLLVKSKGQCLGGYFFVAAGSVIILLTEIIMAMRIYALYCGRKWITILSSILIFISFFANQGFTLAYLATPADLCISKECISPTFTLPFELVVSCSVASSTIIPIGWFCSFIVELFFLFLVIYKTRQLKKMDGDYYLANDRAGVYNRNIMGLMVRDSKKYFLMIFIVFFIATCTTIILLVLNATTNQIAAFSLFILGAQRNSALTIVIACITILAPKLFLNIRIEYYGPVGVLTKTLDVDLSWDVALPTMHPQEDGSDLREDLEVATDLS